MSTPRTFQKGDPFQSWDHLRIWLESGHWVYCGHKIMHPGFVISMPYRTVLQFFNSQRLFRAFKIHKGEI